MDYNPDCPAWGNLTWPKVGEFDLANGAHIGLAPGTSLHETMRVGTQISQALMRLPGVRMVAQTAGRASEVVDPAGVQLSEIEISLNRMDAGEQDAILNRIRRLLSQFPGITASVNTFLIERIDETISGSTAPVVVNVFGPSLDVIEHASQQIAQWLGTLQGAANVHVDSSAGMPVWSIRLKREELSLWGLRPVDVLDAIEAACQGSTVAQAYSGSQVIDVTVMLAASARGRIVDIGALMMRKPDGRFIALHELAEIRQVTGRYQITHREGQRVQSINVTPGSRGASDFVDEARKRLEHELRLPQGVFVTFAGESESRRQSVRDLILHGAIAGVGILLLLRLALKSRRAVVLVMVNLPFALVGGALSAVAALGDLSLGAMVGFVTLFGITVRNAIMLISHFEQLVHVEKKKWELATALLGAGDRLAPILMTALVTALALIPLALTSGVPGNEVEGPMAIVILGGLLSSNTLTLLILPILVSRYGKLAISIA